MPPAAPYPYHQFHGLDVVYAQGLHQWLETCRIEEMREFSLVFVVRDSQGLLLGMKKRGFGVGYFNGFGGKPHVGETILECARRELLEESGILVEKSEMLYAGRLCIARRDTEGIVTTILTHIFCCSSWLGDPAETEEMRPQWFSFATDPLPFSQMHPEAKHYLPCLLDAMTERRRGFLLVRVDYESTPTQLEMTGCWVGWVD